MPASPELPTRARPERARPRSGCPDGMVAPAPTIVSAASETSGLSTAYGADDRVVARVPPCETRAPVVQHRAVELGAGLDDRAARRAPSARTRARPRCVRRRRAASARRRVASGSIVASPCIQMPRTSLARAGRGRTADAPAQHVGVRLRGTSRASRCRASTRRSGSRTAAGLARACAGTSRARPTR